METVEFFPRIANCLNPNLFNLILFPTEKCNFRCTYCYEDFKLGKMSDQTIAAVKQLLTNRAQDLHSLVIGWFGGEPLLAKSIIYDISSHILSLVHDLPNLRYGANITTNGYLLDAETFEELVAHGISTFQISLDGNTELHNRTRLRADGRGTFDRIWKNLLSIRNSTHPVKIIIRSHYSPDTWQQLSPLIDRINEEFSEDSRFTVYFKEIERLGGPNDESIRTFTEETQQHVQEVLNSKLRFERMIYKLSPDGVYICYASMANSLAIRANGDIVKCTVALADPQNTVGQLNPDGTIKIDQERLSPWLRGIVTRDASTLACPYTKMAPSIKPNSAREHIDIGLSSINIIQSN